MENPLLLILGSLLAALVVLVVRALTRNSWIKKRLGLSLFFLCASAVLSTVHYYQPEEALPVIAKLTLLLALIFAVVVLIFNRFGRGAVSEKYPSIVQDAIVIGTFAIIAAIWFPERFFTTSAIAALVIGLALQDTLGNLFSGVALQIEKPFFVGDWVRLGELEGRVMEVTWRATKIRTKGGNFHIIPNTVISKGSIVNFSHPSRLLRVEKQIGFSYDVPPNRIKRLVLDTVHDVPEILTEPPADVLLDHYGDSSLVYRCRFWIDDFGRGEWIMDKFTTLLYYRLARAGIRIPFPIRDLRIQEPGPPAAEKEKVELERRRAFVNQVDLFETLSEEDRREIARRLDLIIFAADEPIVRQGEEGDSMFFIKTGKVRITVDKEGAVSQLAVLGDGHYLGEMALLTGEVRSAGATAVSDVEIYVLRKDAFREVLLKDPKIAVQISEVMAKRRTVLQTRSEELAARKPSRTQVQKTFLKRIRSFFGLT